MNDIKFSPLYEVDEYMFENEPEECWILAYGRLLSESELQCVTEDGIRIFQIDGPIHPTKTYDIIIIGRYAKNKIKVCKLWEPELCKPYVYDIEGPIPFIYIDTSTAFIQSEKKHTILAAEIKKKNGATKEFINMTVKKYDANLAPIFLVKETKKSDVGIAKKIMKGVQLGSYVSFNEL